LLNYLRVIDLSSHGLFIIFAKRDATRRLARIFHGVKTPWEKTPWLARGLKTYYLSSELC
jgi:hypothetical protein